MNKYLPYAILVAELLAFLFILLSSPLIPSDPILLFTELLAFGFVAWGTYTLYGKSTFSFFAKPHPKSSLITNGPFEYIRHPMYSGMLLFALVSIINVVTIPRLIAFTLLLLILLYQLHLEEEYLEDHFGEYKAYQKRTKKLIPFVF